MMVKLTEKDEGQRKARKKDDREERATLYEQDDPPLAW